MPAYRTREAFSRSLEVSTDAQLPPQVSIVSPTPRAFTFSHDIHFTSPSRSPFDEPELKQFSTPPPVRTLSPTSSIASETTTSSSFFSSPSAASSQASHRRRRSVAGDNERRPKRGDEDYIKRPENAFILFRRKCCEERQQAMEDASSTDDAAVTPVIKKQRQADLSKQISQQWKSLSAEERAYWEDLAKEKKKEHEAMYPNYVYRPQRTKDKKGKKGKNGKGGDPETDAEGGITFVMPVPSAPRSLSRGPSYNGHSQGRRAVSAPTPPPAYQTIQLPTLSTPFCATSPSSPSMVPTLPRISRRVPVPNFEIPRPSDTDPSTHYEYVPEDTLFPSTFERMNNYNTTTTSNDNFPMLQFSGKQAPSDGNSNAIPLQALSIPRDSTMYAPSDLVSPADSIASSISSSSAQGGPFTPADALSMNTLAMHHLPGGATSLDSVDESAMHVMSFAGYSWQTQSLWADATSEVMLPDDFDLSAIPPIELGLTQEETTPNQETEYAPLGDEHDFDNQEFDNSEFDNEFDNREFDNRTPGGHDPFSNLFTYDAMNW